MDKTHTQKAICIEYALYKYPNEPLVLEVRIVVILGGLCLEGNKGSGDSGGW